MQPPYEKGFTLLHARRIQQEDEDQISKQPIILQHSAMAHNALQTIACPAHLAGRATVKCDNGIVSIYSGKSKIQWACIDLLGKSKMRQRVC